LDANGNAEGQLFLDDGESLDTINTTSYGLVNYTVSNGNLNCSLISGAYTTSNISSIKIYGLTSVSGVDINGFSYDSFTFTNQVLTIYDLVITTITPWVISWLE